MLLQVFARATSLDVGHRLDEATPPVNDLIREVFIKLRSFNLSYLSYCCRQSIPGY